jgi:serine/threonine protein kinase
MPRHLLSYCSYDNYTFTSSVGAKLKQPIFLYTLGERMSSENSHIGMSLGNYRITAEIGSGGFGNVYQGQHTILTERSVAIKQLHGHLASPKEREQFLEEARLLERLKHPHILHIFDVGIHDGFPYLVAEYAPNGSLRDRLNTSTSNPLSIEEALAILSQVGQALHYAHQHNVIHRDLKPANILFDANGEALLADFGIATTLSTTSITHAAIIGTPPYMAPEQFQGSVSKESDQYSLGCIAYELFTGRVPFTASDFFAMGFEHMTKAPIPPTQLNPYLPVHIERAILKALAKQRGDRHANIKAFIDALYKPDETPSSMLTEYSHVLIINREQKIPNSPVREGPTHQSTRSIFNPERVTPIPDVNPFLPNTMGAHQEHATARQEHTTSLPPTSELTRTLSSKGPVTPIPSFDELVTGVTGTIPLSHKIAARTQAEKKSNDKRKWMLIAIAVLLFISINAGAFYYAFSRGPSQNQGSINNSTPGPIETVSFHYTNGMSGVSTKHTYHGSVYITVSGTGQEAKNKWNDAFYQYTDAHGNAITPVHTSTYPGWGLWINGGVADNYVKPIPAYHSNHYYIFTIHLQQTGYLTFAIGDPYTKDDTGSLSLTVTQEN